MLLLWMSSGVCHDTLGQCRDIGCSFVLSPFCSLCCNIEPPMLQHNSLSVKTSLICNTELRKIRESLYKAWEHFKLMLCNCPYHGLQDWLQLKYSTLDLTGIYTLVLIEHPLEYSCQRLMSSDSHIEPNKWQRTLSLERISINKSSKGPDNESNHMEVNYVRNRGYNPFSNSYNPRWHYHPNFR
ncbi:hypothetical protein EPI10_006234 [Gossypium australe]|uniref:Uncharacterized protein n=1 Tax=Gossypium australe TaxID=47621 RepID=A0A5B6WQH6_9ROSI|nr:hypothetical protein EPI10_006234 [Gossypium australe]